jgi:hypothetical protein
MQDGLIINKYKHFKTKKIMAKASWCSVSPTSGSAGETIISISASVHTGRTGRSTILTFQTTTGSPIVTKTLNLGQDGAGNILTVPTSKSVAKAGGTVLIEGTSNAPSLSFYVGNNTGGNINGFTLSKMEISKDNGSTWSAIQSTASITGDPGGADAYKWRATVAVAANTTVSARSAALYISNASVYPTPTPISPTPAPNTTLGMVNITQAAGDASLTLSATTLSLSATGAAKTVTATSNTTYGIS